MGCDISRKQLWSWIDREAPELEAHLATCPACRARADEIRAEIGLLESDTSLLDVPLPETIGPYAIKHLLGEGGQALVYEAEQPSPKRRVALKVLRGGRFASARHVKHFQRETQTLANLEHPAIATIYEAGRTEEGQHYFAMELVAGTPLDLYVADGDITREQRLELFCRICDAVQHAHEQGVVHRDLKPTNILVTAAGDPKILDFGLARMTDSDVAMSAMMTRSEAVEGTPRYMSPEQARGRASEIDARSDVYSLGVTLYELLTDNPPYEISTFSAEALQTVCEAMPRRPSEIDATLRGDLETIVLKALEKDPDARYRSVASLADDIRRHLRGEAITARPVSRLTLLRRWCVRHRSRIAGVAAAIILLALVGGQTGLWRVWQPPYDEARARQQLLELRCTLRESGISDLIYAEIGRARGRYQALPEATLLMAQAHFARREPRMAMDLLDEQLTDDPAAWWARVLLAEIHIAQSSPEVERYRRWRETARLPTTAEAWYLRSFVSLEPTAALAAAREAVALDRDHLLALRSVARLSAQNGELEPALAAAARLIELGDDEWTWRRFRGGLLAGAKRYREALVEFDRYVALLPEYEAAHNSRAAVLRRLGQYDAAIREYTTTIELGDRGRRAAWWYYHRATVYWIAGQPEAALADYQRAFEQLTFPTYGNARLVLILHELGRSAEAAAALAEARRRAEPDSWLARIFACIAGELAPEDLVAAGRAAGGGAPDSPQLCEGCYYAGEACLLQGRAVEARRWFEQCVAAGVEFDPGTFMDVMSEHELAEWRLRQLSGTGEVGPLKL